MMVAIDIVRVSRAAPFLRGLQWLVAAMVMVSVLVPGAARAQYLLGPGDRFDVTVYGAPDLGRRMTVNADGMISFPLIGAVPAAGMTIIQLKERLQQLLTQRQIVNNADVSIEIVEHRPFFISGDIARPGSYQWQPGSTVRHAVALSGGYDLVRYRFGVNPFVQAADLRSDYETLRAELFRDETRLKRLLAELDGKDDIDWGDAPTMAVPPKLFQQITDVERKLLKERMSNYARERASLRKSYEFSREQSETLEEQVKTEEEAYKQQMEDFQRTKSLNEKGVVPVTRVLDEQRTLAMGRSRTLVTAGQSATAKRAMEESRRALDRFEESRKTELLALITDARLSIDRTNSRLQATAEKYSVVGAARSTIVSGINDVTIKIHRRVNGKAGTIEATEDTALMPDDLVEVTLNQARIAGAAVNIREPER
ncbi:polysaccharide biosynthesis/export family protein [Alsobacter sp. R-9]